MQHDPRLEAVPLFRALNAQARRILSEGAVPRRFAPGETLWTAGAEPRGLFVLLEGRVRVVRAPGGRQYVLHTEGPGGTLGEVPLFSGGRYPATAIAVDSVLSLALDRRVLARAIAADPELAFGLLGRLSERVRILVGRLDRGASEPVEARVAAYLLERHRVARGAAFTLDATQAEVAEELGTVREVLVRALRRLRERGLIASAGRGRYRVLVEPELQRAARRRTRA